MYACPYVSIFAEFASFDSFGEIAARSLVTLTSIPNASRSPRMARSTTSRTLTPSFRGVGFDATASMSRWRARNAHALTAQGAGTVCARHPSHR